MLCPQLTNVFSSALLKTSRASVLVSKFPHCTEVLWIWSHHLTSSNLSILNIIRLEKYLPDLSYSINNEEKNRISFLLYLFNVCNKPAVGP